MESGPVRLEAKTTVMAVPPQAQEGNFSRLSARCWAIASRVANAVADFFKAIGRIILQGYSRLKNTVFRTQLEQKPNEPEDIDQAAASTKETHEGSFARPTSSQQKRAERLRRLVTRGLAALEKSKKALEVEMPTGAGSQSESPTRPT